MTAWLDKLNLTPTERRLVIGGVIVLIVLFNWLFVWPYFGDWMKTEIELGKTRLAVGKYMSEIKNRAEYERKLKELQNFGGQIQAEDQANKVQGVVYTQAGASGVAINSFQFVNTLARTQLGNAASATNQFFDEKVANVDFSASEESLVNFLYALGNGDSMIRVREIVNLRLDPAAGNTRLAGKLTLVASFQRKIAAPPAPPARVVATNKAPLVTTSGKPVTNAAGSPVPNKPKK